MKKYLLALSLTFMLSAAGTSVAMDGFEVPQAVISGAGRVDDILFSCEDLSDTVKVERIRRVMGECDINDDAFLPGSGLNLLEYYLRVLSH